MNNWEFKSADFAVLRTPLLPENSSDKMHTNAVNCDLDEQLRVSLNELISLVNKTEVSQSIRLASVSLYEKIDQLNNKLTEENLKLASSIYKYVVRMSTRPTPFGGFSNVMTLPLANQSKINIPAAVKLFARLDNKCVNLVADLFKTWCHQNNNLNLLVRVNSSLYELGGEYRYVSQNIKDDFNTHQMDSVQINQAIKETIEFTKKWKTVEQVVVHLSGIFNHLKPSELLQFIFGLLKNQIIESNLNFVVGSNNSFKSLIIRAIQSKVSPELVGQAQKIESYLQSINELGAQNFSKNLGQAKQILEQLLPESELKKWIHVDAFKNGQQQKIAKDTVNGVVETIQRLAGLFWRPSSQLDEFTTKFQNLYESAEVPLLEALDVDSGISFGPTRNGRSPLLNGIGFGHQQFDEKIKWRAFDNFLMIRVVEAIKQQNKRLHIKLDDLEKLKPYFHVPNQAFEDTVSIMGTFMASDDAGNSPLFKLSAISGPSSLSLLGRFCCGDRDLEIACKKVAVKEQLLNKKVIKAEIIHAQQAITANISGRPQLRDKEIICNPGDSDIGEEDQITCQDLYLKIHQGRLVLFSKKLNCEIAPRLASAHNTSGLNLPIYQFLHAMQYQAGYFNVQMMSKPLDMLPYLPEIRIDNLIMTPQRWLINIHEIRVIKACKNKSERLEKLYKIKQIRGLSQYVAIKEGDNILDFNLDSVFSSMMLISELIKKEQTVILIESLQGRTDDFISSNNEKFRHEMVMPIFVSNGLNSDEVAINDTEAISINEAKTKASLPNESWKYLKIYAGEASADRLLADHLSHVANQLVIENKIEHWHFIRYQDPDFHIRLRFKLKQNFKTDDIDALLYPKIKSLYQQGIISNVIESSHMPEFERYGGPDILPICEQLFFHNSLIVTDFIAQTAAKKNRDELRWQLTLNQAWQLALGVCGSLEKVEIYFKQNAAAYDREFGNNEFIKKKLSENYRSKMQQVAEAISPDFLNSFQGSKAAKQQDNYQQTVRHLIKACEIHNKDVLDILPSLIHMDCNRSFVLLGRANEWMLYHYLARYTRTVIARKFIPGVQIAGGLGFQRISSISAS